jgi:DNA-binding MarR family transcriptional regulator
VNEVNRGEPAPVALAVIHAARSLDARLESVLAPLRMSVAKMGVLHHLVQEGAPLPLSVLADRNRCVRSNITQLADRLEADGYLRRVPAPGDRRAVLAEPTTAGVLAYQQAVELMAAEEARLTSALSPELRRQFLQLAAELSEQP